MESQQMCVRQSENKLNQLSMKAQPIGEELSTAIEKGDISPEQDAKLRESKLAVMYGWNTSDARNIWCFGPDANGPNLLVDVSKGALYLDDIKDSVVAGFQWATKKGVLCEEKMRGIRFDIHDASLHSDAIHRGGGQIISTAKRCLYGCQLTAGPLLLEPVYLVEIQCPNTVASAIHDVVTRKRGRVFEEVQTPGIPMFNVKAYLPVNESFGFNSALHSSTQGMAFPQCVFDHWGVLPSDPHMNNNSAAIIKSVRVRKGLEVPGPSLENFID